MTQMKALIVEDDMETVDFVSPGLASKGFVCDQASTGEAGLRLISTRQYDVAIVDIKLRDNVNGLALVKSARMKGIKTPIILLSAMNLASDRILGLNCGADDYLGKPFARDELLARVMAHVRRAGYTRAENVLKALDITLCPETHEIHRGNRQICLTSGECALLELLMRNVGKSVSARRILRDVWGFDYVPTSKVVESRICSLRKKLCANGEPNVIFTERGFGYVLRKDC